MREFTVIIPTWNMGRYLEALFQSIVDSPFAEIVEEVIFVCDRSTDGSEEVIANLASRQGDRLPRVTLLQPPERRGLFIARYLGAKAAKTNRILYIDSRITLPAASAKALPDLARQYGAMIAHVDIDVRKNIFCLYWERSHNVFYRRNKDVEQRIVTIHPGNFADIRVGGTCEFCRLGPLHVGVILAYGFGALRGAWIVWRRNQLRGKT
jgi:glycosyltransferase involved in cell wall biosynthesis